LSDLFCPVRKSWCKALPEEEVRISLMTNMISQLEFPISVIAVEKDLRHLPHLQSVRGLPNRRSDIMCFLQGKPLLLVECKAVPITTKVLNQVIGYNFYVKAPFICVANHKEVRTGWLDKEGIYQFIPYLPRYGELAAAGAQVR
jgi:hypothetical protein